MTEIRQHQIKHLATITVNGNDAMTFLQGQCTQDITKIPSFGALPGAFCSAKGRVVTNVWIHRVNETQNQFELICHTSSAAALFSHLKKYVPFFRGTTMTLNESDSLNVIGYIDQPTQEGFTLNNTMRICLSSELPATKATDSEAWKVEEIKQGILWLNEQQFDQWIPQNISLDSLNAISFSKGCYTGQEVVSRLHYKGTSKKRLFAVACDTQLSLEQSIFANGKPIGTVIQVAKDQQTYVGLAILKTDTTENPLFADENEQVQIELLHSFETASNGHR